MLFFVVPRRCSVSARKRAILSQLRCTQDRQYCAFSTKLKNEKKGERGHQIDSNNNTKTHRERHLILLTLRSWPTRRSFRRAVLDAHRTEESEIDGKISKNVLQQYCVVDVARREYLLCIVFRLLMLVRITHAHGHADC